MKDYGYNLDVTRDQFHAKSVSFNGFKDITLKDIQRIKKLIESKSFIKAVKIGNPGLEKYANTLHILLNPTIHYELKTFDEKIMFLILSVDPELKNLQLFLGSEITPLRDIQEAKDPFEATALKTLRKEQINDYITRVRKALGFYDANLLKYEKILAQGLLKQEDFVTGVRIPSIKQLMDIAERIKNLDIITNSNLIRLKRIAQKWFTEAKDPSDLNSLAYNLLNNYKNLHIFTIEEQMVLFILIGDPNLDLLRIFEEESKMDMVEERAISELGFYGRGFIKVEKLYHDKFMPTKEISPWTK